MSNNTTKTQVCNRALYLIKAESALTDFDTDQTEAARICRSIFDDSVDYVLEQHPWNHAMVRVQLSQDSTAPVYYYDYRFQLPSSPYCLKVQEVVDSEGFEVDEYEIIGRFIETNSDDIYIKYISRVSDLTKWSAGFREALAYYLASQLAGPLLRSSEVRDENIKAFRYVLDHAETADSQQGTPRKETDNDYSWISRRFSSGYRADKNYSS